MAFNSNNFSTAGAQSARGAAAQLFTYITTDSRTDITADGYFDPIRTMLSKNDIIISVTAQGFTIFRVTMVPITGRVTTSIASSSASNKDNLSELEDVDVQSILNNQVLQYDDVSNTWKNQSLAAVASSGSYSDLSGTPDIPSAYTLPLSADGTRGGIQIGYSQTGQNYPVELASEKAFVAVPWTDTTYSVGDGGLTQNNFTDALKSKLDAIAENADVTNSTNVAAAGAIMDSDFSVNGFMKRTGAGTYTTDTNTYLTTIPLATSSANGGIKIGYTGNGKNYPVELDNGQAFVNVPWTATSGLPSNPTDGDFLVGDGTDWVQENGSTARDSLSLGTGDDVNFANLQLGGSGTAASATTYQRSSTTWLTTGINAQNEAYIDAPNKFEIAAGATRQYVRLNTDGFGYNITPGAGSTQEGFTIYNDNLHIKNQENGGIPTLNMGATNLEAFKIKTFYHAGTQEIAYTQFISYTESATSNRGKFIFSIDEDDKLEIRDDGMRLDGKLIISDDLLPVVSNEKFTVDDGNIHLRGATNDINPYIDIGSSSLESFKSQVYYAAGSQQLAYVEFATKTASTTANRGQYIFKVDESEKFRINDSGVVVTGDISVTGNISMDANATVDGVDVSQLTTTSSPQFANLKLEALNPYLKFTDTDAGVSNQQEIGHLLWHSKDSSLPSGDAPTAKIKVIHDNTSVAPDGRIVFQCGVNGVLSNDFEIRDDLTVSHNAIVAQDNTDNYSTFGRAVIGGTSHHTDFAWFSHRDSVGSSGNYSMLASNVGRTLINCASSQRIEFRVNNSTRWTMGSTGGIYAYNASGGDKGAGRLNADAVYDDGSLLTCYPIEYYLHNKVDLDYWNSINNGKLHARAESFIKEERFKYLDVDNYCKYFKEHEHLPSLPSKKDWKHNELSIGELIMRLTENADMNAAHIDQLNNRIKQLENNG